MMMMLFQTLDRYPSQNTERYLFFVMVFAFKCFSFSHSVYVPAIFLYFEIRSGDKIETEFIANWLNEL